MLKMLHCKLDLMRGDPDTRHANKSQSVIQATSEFVCLQEKAVQGKPVLVAEVCRPSPASSSQDVAKLASDYVSWGVDAIVVPTDLEDTPAGLSDLFAVCRAVRVPVLQWDWFVHPLQVRHLLCTLITSILCSVHIHTLHIHMVCILSFHIYV